MGVDNAAFVIIPDPHNCAVMVTAPRKLDTSIHIYPGLVMHGGTRYVVSG